MTAPPITTALLAADLQAQRRLRLAQHRDDAQQHVDACAEKSDAARHRVMDLMDAGYSPHSLVYTEAHDHWKACVDRHDEAADDLRVAFLAWLEASA